MTLRLTASSPDYAAVNELADMIAVATNPNLSGADMDLPDAEQRALLAILKSEMQERIDSATGPLVEYAEQVIGLGM